MSTQTKLLSIIPGSCTPALLPKLGPSQAKELATVFKALADPTRVQIVSLLLEAGERGLCVCDIVANFPLGQPTISHHLKLLRDARLLLSRKQGLWVFYSLNRERLACLGIAVPPIGVLPQEEAREAVGTTRGFPYRRAAVGSTVRNRGANHGQS